MKFNFMPPTCIRTIAHITVYDIFAVGFFLLVVVIV
jgi:hypothetical protein